MPNKITAAPDQKIPPDSAYLEEMTAAIDTTLCSLYEGLAINFPHMSAELHRIWALHRQDIEAASTRLKARHERQ